MVDRFFRSGDIRAAVLPLCGLVLLASCATILATKIADIKETPGAFEGRTVTIAGKVTSTYNLVLVKYYEVDDGTGTIPVVTESALPKEGESVRIKGRVNQAFAIGTARLVVVVEEPPPR
jgi:aspartyl/asparaginyl-tRNA synthetase